MDSKQGEVKRFVKKPIEIEAIQYTGHNRDEVKAFCPTAIYTQLPRWGWGFHLLTMDGQMVVRAGDWIIKGIKGEFYPCKPDIFEATYQEVNPMNPQVDAEAKAREGFAWYWENVNQDADWETWQAALKYAASQVPKNVGEVVAEFESEVLQVAGTDSGVLFGCPPLPLVVGNKVIVQIRKPVQAVEGERGSCEA